MIVRTKEMNRNSTITLLRNMKSQRAPLLLNSILVLLFFVAALGVARVSHAQKQAGEDDFYPAWAAHAKYLQPLRVVDTDSALGRRNLHPKSITLKEMARLHGHLCDGLVTSWVQLSVALRLLFPDGVVDRTDLRVVSRNCPCCVDAGAWMTGARINQGTLMLDNSVGVGFIVQRISTGAAVRVSQRPGFYPAPLAELEQSIRSRCAHGESVSSTEIDRFEHGADEYSRKLLNTPPDRAVVVERLADYHFPDHSQNPIATRSDTINRDAPRTLPQPAVTQQH